MGKKVRCAFTAERRSLDVDGWETKKQERGPLREQVMEKQRDTWSCNNFTKVLSTENAQSHEGLDQAVLHLTRIRKVQQRGQVHGGHRP